jgi:hypothetical protein
MQAFRAANPGCVFEDFIRWYSPNDWVISEELHHDDYDDENHGDDHGDDSSSAETRAVSSADASSSSSSSSLSDHHAGGRLRYTFVFILISIRCHHTQKCESRILRYYFHETVETIALLNPLLV